MKLLIIRLNTNASINTINVYFIGAGVSPGECGQ
ncbi:hypothetical protein Stok01_02361 [Sulfurisphaera tokodaii]